MAKLQYMQYIVHDSFYLIRCTEAFDSHYF